MNYKTREGGATVTVLVVYSTLFAIAPEVSIEMAVIATMMPGSLSFFLFTLFSSFVIGYRNTRTLCKFNS